MRLAGKTAIVTGASAGIGEAIAALFAREGANVVAVARRLDRLEQLAAAEKDAPGKIVPCRGDIGEPSTSRRMVDLAVTSFGRLDILVNNAGIMDDNTAVGDVSDEMIHDLLRVNTCGPLYAMREAVRAFLAQGDEGGQYHQCRLRGRRPPDRGRGLLRLQGGAGVRHQKHGLHVPGAGDPLQRHFPRRRSHRHPSRDAESR